MRLWRPVLPGAPRVPPAERRRLEEDYEGLADAPWPASIRGYILERYAVDPAARFAGWELPHPIGKASGQLSLTEAQVRADAKAGLAFVVLKTVISEDAEGRSAMAAWKIPAARMECERIVSSRGEPGWTITWIGRGWEGSLEEYAAFTRSAVAIGLEHGMPVIPSVKFHLPAEPDEPFRREEYAHTLARLSAAWREGGGQGPLPIEKDLSPTLAGSDRARAKAAVLRWLSELPGLVASEAPPSGVRLGLKLMNALFEDEFQVEMLRAAARARPRPAFLTCFNRLFDPEREYAGVRGVAYGGPDLSDRNLSALEAWLPERPRDLPLSATGNIESGRMLCEYALRGASSGQVHTYFQLPRSEYRSRAPRPRAALHELLFHPERGLVASLLRLRELAGRKHLAFLELEDLGRTLLGET